MTYYRHLFLYPVSVSTFATRNNVAEAEGSVLRLEDYSGVDEYDLSMSVRRQHRYAVRPVPIVESVSRRPLRLPM